MQQRITVFRVFIASPNDLNEERQGLREIVDSINAIFSRETDWRIELLGWEDTLPGAGRPQDLINIDVDKADLFIGCLWRRWGTITGSDGKTGFEEEFDRAFARRERTHEPDLWLFFKDIPQEERSDPGPQLKKVLAFREREEKAKRLLFQRFTDVADWRKRIEPLLHRQLLRLVARDLQQRSAEASQPHVPASSAPSTASPGSQPTNSPAVASVAALLRYVGESLTSQSLLAFRESPDFDNPRCVRLLVFAASLYALKVQSIEFGSHEANSTYVHRSRLKLTGQERLFLIKTVLRDYSLTKPGWYWAHRWAAKITDWLPWLIKYEADEAMRMRALEFCTQIGFPIHGATGRKAAYTALEDQSVGVRLCALTYFAKYGSALSVKAIEPLLRDPDSDVKKEARGAIHAIRIRSNPNQEIRQVIATESGLTPPLLDALNQNIARFNASTLELCLNHSSPVLRARAAEELQRRGALSLPAALQLVTDDSRRVREVAFYALIDHGAAPPPVEIRKQLASQHIFSLSLTGESVDPEKVVAHYFAKLAADKLWTFVDLLDENSHLALRAILERFSTTNGQLIRDELTDDFGQRVAAAKARRDQQSSALPSLFTFFGEDPIETERKNLRAAALHGLADDPREGDRSLFQRFLSSELSAADPTIACLRGLSRVGKHDDIASVKPLLTSASSAVKAAAARCCLEIANDFPAMIKDLVAARSEPTLWIIVAASLKRRDRRAWDHLRLLLSDSNDEIRRLMCYYATSILPRKELLAELNTYLKGTWYYYNVIALFDRALYAPPSARAYFKQQEVTHFDKLSKEATRNWPGLTL